MSGDRAQCCVSGFSMNLTRRITVARLSAKRLRRETCARQQRAHEQLVLHADRGASMS